MADGRDLLVEIGTEELPPAALRRLMEAFHNGVTQGLAAADLAGTDSRGFASPRRLAVLIHGVPEAQPEQLIEQRGPALSMAFDADGQPTRAAEGFARSRGVSVGELETLRTDKGEWLVHRAQQPGQCTTELLPEIVQTALDQLPIPKRMRWGTSRATFVRPVHWTVALFGEAVVPMTLLDNATGRSTRGHRFHAPDWIELADPGEYERRLESEGWVIPDFDRRRTRVWEGVTALAREGAGEVIADADLVDEVTAMVEWPVPLAGTFDEAFLRVPAEALISSMQGHQKVFPVRDANTGTLLPRFITVANLESRDPGEVIRGNERVIRPRLADAAFFWDQDRRQTLNDRLDELRGIVFQQQLGSIYDKQARVAGLARVTAQAFDTDPHPAERTAWLAKCDLVTQMVDEFPELQGTMGRYYARNDGEPEAVAEAIAEHYRPRFAGDAPPATAVARAVAVAERADTLAGIFAIGQPPTGDKDPFALRRAALGLMRTLIEGGHHLHLDPLFARALEQLPAGVAEGAEPATVRRFCLERLRGYYQDQGVGAEVFDAVAALDSDDPLDFHRRILACAAFLEMEAAASLAAANKRVANILRKSDEALPEAPDPERFVTDEEQALSAALAPLIDDVDKLAKAGDYQPALERLATLREPVDAFFEGVMVMADDPAVRRNRLALLRQLAGLFGQIADIARLPAGRG